MTQYFDTKEANEKVVLTFDFSAELVAGETLTGAITRAISMQSGVDASPTSLWNGAAQFDASSKAVLQAVQAGLVGRQYLIKMTVGTTNPSKTLTRSGILPVVAS